jgi:uncharacterized protein (TIGR04222 family)
VIRRCLAALALLVATAALLGGAAGAQQESTTGERIRSFTSDVEVAKDGTVTVTEEIVYDFGGNQRHGILRTIPVRFPYDEVRNGYDRVTPLDVVLVTADPGTPSGYVVEGGGDDRTIRIGSASSFVTGQRTYRITYRLRGAINHFDEHDELFLNITGNGWAVPIERAEATVRGPAPATQVACFQGPVDSRLACGSANDGETASTFESTGLGPHEGLTVVVGFPVGAIAPTPRPILEQRWTPAVGFAVRPNTVVPTGVMAAAAVGGFALLARRGRDRRYVGSPTDVVFGPGAADAPTEAAPVREEEPVVEFVPPDGLRPGQVGTLVDEQANTIDVTATIIDLAVRGYLRITEIPAQGWLGAPDWQLDSLRPGNDLKRYENTLLTALFAQGPSVRLSALKYEFATHLKAVEEELYQDMMENGWYRNRPDHTRLAVGIVAVLLIVAGVGLTILLAAASSFGLLGLPLVLFGLLMVFGARVMPSRTARGYGTLRRVLGFKRFIDESEKERARFAEQQNLFSEYLPYAVVFGATEKWARAFAGLDGQLPRTDWYVSNHLFTAALFTQAMGGFTTTTSGTISSVRASSGGSGFSGGSSGGGFGGGGGSSW